MFWVFFISNSASHKIFKKDMPFFVIQIRGGVKSNWTNFELIFYWIFPIIFHLSNQSNHTFSNRIEQILNESSIWKIWLHPIVEVKSNLTNFKLIFIKFFEYFLPFHINRCKFSNQIEHISNEFQFDSTPNSNHP